MNVSDQTIHDLNEALDHADLAIKRQTATTELREMGVVSQVGRGVAHVRGLSQTRSNELLRFPGGRLGIAFNLDETGIGVVMLDASETIRAGDEVRRTGRVLDVPVGDELLGRVIDPVGRPLDNRGSIESTKRLPCEREAPSIMDRSAVRQPLQTGVKVVDALIPIGRGQRELILGDRQTGKTALAVDAILNQKESDVICIYCSIGQRSTNVARVIDQLTRHDAMNHSVVVVGEPAAPPGLQFTAPYAATTIGEYFMEQGRDVLVVYDELGTHARSYRELSLLLRRPPGREAFPGDIFYVHSRLLERSTHLREEEGGGSLTAIPIVETEAQNLSAYIPTNLISITDGQIYLSPDRFQKGIMPAVDVGRSVSRVGGKSQLPAYRKVTGDLRLSYTQFEELEKFARFSSQLDEHTSQILERGKRVREILKQPLHETLTVPEQIVVLVAVTNGVFDQVSTQDLSDAGQKVQATVPKEIPDICETIERGGSLDDDAIDTIRRLALTVVADFAREKNDVVS
ncbi:MAG: alternate F1F0 ATPase, F1 subunit alpha [Planctomycetales bacterium]|nr:alternate F1F0 ATPase, F1 subunit alpha [Planctomycetales bacterium]